MTDYEGIFSHECFGKIKVMAEDSERLLLEYGRFGQMVLVPLTETQFQGYYIGKLWFVTNSDGNTSPYVVSFVIENNLVSKIQFPIDFSEKPINFLRGTCNVIMSSLRVTSLVTLIVTVQMLTVS